MGGEEGEETLVAYNGGKWKEQKVKKKVVGGNDEDSRG